MDTLTKKTTLLFSPGLYRRLTQVAEQRGASVGELVRRACEKEYGAASEEEKISAVRRISELSLPVPSVREMKRQPGARAGRLAQ